MGPALLGFTISRLLMWMLRLEKPRGRRERGGILFRIQIPSMLRMQQKNTDACVAGGSYYRARYYDPQIGRFITEDPVGFEAGMNFYAYVDNRPVDLIDPLGLQASGGYVTAPPSRKRRNTHVCDGLGGQTVLLDRAGTELLRKCLIDCMVLHEITHIIDATVAEPTICVGKPVGTRVLSWGQLHDQNEVRASNVEIMCLKKKLDDAKKKDCRGGPCKTIIEQRIKQMEDYRDKRGPYADR